MMLLRNQIGSLLDVQDSNDPEGLRVFYYLIQDLKCFVFSLVNVHLKVGKEEPSIFLSFFNSSSSTSFDLTYKIQNQNSQIKPIPS